MNGFSSQTDATEGDVETQFVVPLLTNSEFLNIDLVHIKSKEFLASFDIGKGAKTRKGYIPDFCVYMHSLPLLSIEVKAPNVSIQDAWSESSLYALELNKRYPTNINPCKSIFVTNGINYSAGVWDNMVPIVSGLVNELLVGSEDLETLRSLIGKRELERQGRDLSGLLRLVGFKRPFNSGTGPVLIESKVEPNTFAAQLSPILRRYFSSRDQNKDPEVYKSAYVSSDEVTSYDKILDSYLIDRLSRSKTRVPIQTTKRNANAVAMRIDALTAGPGQSGELQLITGGVGTGKSLFARRYKEFLQTPAQRESCHWAFLDFNFAPPELSNIDEWIHQNFVQSLIEEGAPIDLRDALDQERVFANDLKDREAYYERMEAVGAGRGLLEKARDIENWRLDPLKLGLGVSRYLQGDRGHVLIVVFDNVDRRDVTSQLLAFETALAFMNRFKCLVLLQMRDSTFEAHKNHPPLDTYKTGMIFHISPPRFIDVVKRRLELSLKELDKEAPEKIEYKTPNGLSISYPKARAGAFLNMIYLELFQRTNNTSRILEALAGRNVRKALDMFMAVITSGHMPEDLVATVASGNSLRRFPEFLVLKIIMRQDYRFFSKNSGFVANIFYCDPNWERPSNLLVPEILFYLIGQRKTNGENGQMGYVAYARLSEHLEKLGFVHSDIKAGTLYLIESELVEADAAITEQMKDSICIKATASGWVHMRLLASRTEYVASVLPTTPINDSVFEARIFDSMQIESRKGRISRSQSENLVAQFGAYLQKQYDNLKVHAGYDKDEPNGAKYILRKIDEAIAFQKKAQNTADPQMDWLDT
jgi:hypothetical protein